MSGIFSCGAFFTPWVSWLKSFSETKETGSACTGGASIGWAEIAMKPSTSAAA